MKLEIQILSDWKGAKLIPFKDSCLISYRQKGLTHWTERLLYINGMHEQWHETFNLHKHWSWRELSRGGCNKFVVFYYVFEISYVKSLIPVFYISKKVKKGLGENNLLHSNISYLILRLFLALEISFYAILFLFKW